MVKFSLSKEKKVLLICIMIASFLIFAASISGDIGVFGPAIFLSVFIIAAPQLIFSYISYRNIKEIELRFPRFLRDLVEATRAGMPLHKAIIFTSHADYGPLSPEVEKMAKQLTWNVNIIKVLDQAKKRLKKSKTLSRIIRIMIETYKSGGYMDDILNSLSSTLMTIQDTEKDRKSMLSQYVIVMYVISVVFIGIIVGINWLMVPLFESMAAPSARGAVGTFIANPCYSCVGVSNAGCMPCSVYSGICTLFGTETTSISCYYLALFFSISIVQAIMGGLVAGQIGEDSVTAGIKHSLFLLTITLAAFFVLVKLQVLGA